METTPLTGAGRGSNDSAESNEGTGMPPPVGIFFGAFPLVSGAGVAAIALSEDWATACFGLFLPPLALRCIIVFCGIVLACSAAPTLVANRIATSAEFAAMVHAACAADDGFKQKLANDMSTLLCKAVQDAVFGTFVLCALAWVTCRTVYAAAVAAALGFGTIPAERVQKRFLYVMIEVCHKNIDGFVLRMIPELPPAGKEAPDLPWRFRRDINWQELAAAHHSLDLRLERLWAPTLGAMLLVPIVAHLCALGGVLIVIGVVAEGIWAKLCAWALGGYLCLRGVYTLGQPADITTRCTSTSPRFGLRAIRVVVNACSCHRQMAAEEEPAHMRFLQYLSSTTAGVEICGILVTPALVASLAGTLATNLPIAIGVMQGLVNAHF